MQGRNHLLVGSAGILTATAVVHSLSDQGSWLAENVGAAFVGTLGALSPVASWFAWDFPSREEAVTWPAMWADNVLEWVLPNAQWWWVLLAGILAGLGMLLADADNPKSFLGRFVKVPGPHHGFLHTDWMTLIVVGLSVFSFGRPLIWLALGMITHAFLDDLSRGGRGRLYPMGGYRKVVFDDGVPVILRSGNWPGLYKVGNASETRTAAGLLLLCAGVVVAVGGPWWPTGLLVVAPALMLWLALSLKSWQGAWRRRSLV